MIQNYVKYDKNNVRIFGIKNWMLQVKLFNEIGYNGQSCLEYKITSNIVEQKIMNIIIEKQYDVM